MAVQSSAMLIQMNITTLWTLRLKQVAGAPPAGSETERRLLVPYSCGMRGAYGWALRRAEVIKSGNQIK